MEKYKININTQKEHIYPILVIAAGATAFVYFGSYLGFSITDTTIVVFIVAFLFQLVPTILLHLNYYFVNKDDELSYDKKTKKMAFIHQNTIVEFYLSDIDRMIVYKSFPLHKKNSQFLAWDRYNHAILRLQDGTKIILTSLLLGGEIDIPVNPNDIKAKVNLYRWVNGPSLVLSKKNL